MSLDTIFVWDFSHKWSVPAIFIYLFVHWCARHVIYSLGVSTWDDWVSVYCAPFMFRGRPCLFSAVGFLLILKIFRAVLLVYKVSRSRFPFWLFRWVYLSPNFFISWNSGFEISQLIDESQLRSRFLFFIFISIVFNLRLFFRYFSRCL